MTLLGVLNKFAEEYLKKLGEYRETKYRPREREERSYRDEWKRELIENLSKLEFDCGKASMLLKEVVNGELSLKRAVIVIYASLSSKGLVGIGSGILFSVLEIGLSWDYVLDLPVIPGSAVKGATRNLTLDLCANLRDNEARHKCFEFVVRLFGWVESPSESEVRELELLGFDKSYIINIAKKGLGGQGLVVFHDAYPVADKPPGKCTLLEPLVITPHYGSDVEDEYNVKPNPLPHLALKEGSMFGFIVSYDENAKKCLEAVMKFVGGQLGIKVNDHIVFLSHLVAAALRQGVGARTSKGYTSFEVKRIILYRGG